MQSFTDKPEIVNFNIQDDFFVGMMNDKTIISKFEKISDKLDNIGF